MGRYVERARLATVATTVRQALTAAAITGVVGLGAISLADDSRTAPPRSLGLSGQAESSLLERHRCSSTGFADGVIPAKAVLRFPDGRTQVVSFDRGWASFTGDAPGTLVAVCLGVEDAPDAE